MSDIGKSGLVEKRCPECSALFPQETVPTPKKTRRTTSRASSEPLDVIKEAKKRLRYVKKEEKRSRKELAKFEAERIKLEKLLAAAESPVAAVAPIRAQSQ